jgi:regulator of protease activity HflC (stomatin/prohibitin superfamily)
MDPGVHAKAPWQSVEDVNVRVQSKKIFMDGKEGAGSAVSAETQPVFAVVTINFHIRPACSVDLYKEVGGSYFESIIEPRVQQVFKAQTVEYRTIEVAPSREEIRSKVQTTLDSQLDNFCIDVDDFLITNLDFADGFSESIERKQIATQDALAAQEKVKQAEFEAEQKIATAQGEAEALRLKAQAIKDNPQLIQLTWVENLADNVQVIMVPSDGSFIMPGDIFSGGGK